jgi:hypothetical protein
MNQQESENLDREESQNARSARLDLEDAALANTHEKALAQRILRAFAGPVSTASLFPDIETTYVVEGALARTVGITLKLAAMADNSEIPEGAGFAHGTQVDEGELRYLLSALGTLLIEGSALVEEVRGAQAPRRERVQ